MPYRGDERSAGLAADVEVGQHCGAVDGDVKEPLPRAAQGQIGKFQIDRIGQLGTGRA